MTILTVLLLIIGIGAVMQGGGNGPSIFGGGGAYTAKPDAFTLRAGRDQRLDVLMNDLNVERVNPAELSIVQPPSCGAAVIVDGEIQYTDSAECAGEVVLSYCVPSDDSCDFVPVRLNVLRVEQSAPVVAGAPRVMDGVAQGASPQDQPEIALKQPMRLALSGNSEVITPSQATELVRRIGTEPAPTVTAASTSDTAVTVSRTSARSGSVATAGVSMSAPEPSGEGSGIVVSSSTESSAPRPSAPRTMTMAGLAPAAPSGSGVVTPSAPAPVVSDDPEDNDLANVIVMPMPGVAPPAAPSPETTGIAVTAPAEDAAPHLPGTDETEIAAIAPEAAPAPAALPEKPAPAETVAAAPVVEQPRPQPQPPAPPAPVVAAAPAAPETTEPSAAQGAPNTGAEIAAAPTAPEVPDSSGVLASLARSNTVLGATVSAAKALFAPSQPSPRPDPSVTGISSAPRPQDVADLRGLEFASVYIEDSNAGLDLPGTTAAPRPATTEAPVVVAALNPDTGFKLKTRPDAPEAGAVGEIPSPTDTETATEIAPAAEPDPASEAPVMAALQPADKAPPVRLEVPQIGGLAPGNADCEIELALQVQVGAEIVASLSSPCRPSSAFNVDHAGLTFTAETDEDGVANFVVPAMLSNAIIRVSFPDGGTVVARTVVENMSRLTRVAVVWASETDFDLHAREFGAAEGSDGDVWTGNARDYRIARRSGGGYLTALGPQTGPGARAEVYTIFQSVRTAEGEIDLFFRPADPAACERETVVRVLRSERADMVREGDLAIDPAACAAGDTGLGLTAISLLRQ